MTKPLTQHTKQAARRGAHTNLTSSIDQGSVGLDGRGWDGMGGLLDCLSVDLHDVVSSSSSSTNSRQTYKRIAHTHLPLHSRVALSSGCQSLFIGDFPSCPHTLFLGTIYVTNKIPEKILE